jgi:hypothetical protein
MSPVKIVLVILLVLGLLYGLSFALENRTEPSDQSKIFASVPSGDWIKSLADRFGPGFDFRSVDDPHASAKARTFTVPHGQTINIRIAGSSSVQRLKFVPIQPDCNVKYVESKPDMKENGGTDKTYAITDQGGILTITCSRSQDYILKVK